MRNLRKKRESLCNSLMFSSSMLPANIPQIKERTLTTPGHVVPTFGSLLNSSSSPKLANANSQSSKFTGA